MVVRILGFVALVCALALLVAGLDYYTVPIPERPFSPLHAQFAPSGLIGQGLGIVGTSMMGLGVLSYGARKRIRALARFGKLKDWLRFHILLCLLGPFLVVLHTTFKFGGLVAIAFWCMALVVASGVFGRWVYVWIPKTTNGRFLGRKEIRQRLHQIVHELGDELKVSPDAVLELADPRRRAHGHRAADSTARTRSSAGEARPPRWEGEERRRSSRTRLGISGAVLEGLRYALGRRAERARLRRALAAAGVGEPARSRLVRGLEEERRIEQQLRLLEPFQAAFRYWHAFHLPLAVVMVLVLVVHVGVAIAFGYTWIWGL